MLGDERVLQAIPRCDDALDERAAERFGMIRRGQLEDENPRAHLLHKSFEAALKLLARLGELVRVFARAAVELLHLSVRRGGVRVLEEVVAYVRLVLVDVIGVTRRHRLVTRVEVLLEPCYHHVRRGQHALKFLQRLSKH